MNVMVYNSSEREITAASLGSAMELIEKQLMEKEVRGISDGMVWSWG